MQDPTEHPKGPQRDPKNNESRRYGGRFWAPLAAHKGPQRGPQDTLGAPRGPPKQRQTKTQSPLTKNAEDKKRTTNTHPNSERYLRGFCAHALRGAFFGDAAARRKHKNIRVTAVLDPKGCQNARKPCILRGFVNTRLSQRRHSAQIPVVICGLVLHWVPARNRKTRPKTGLKVVVTLVRLWGPRSSPRGCPERAKSPRRTAKHDVKRGFSKNY